MNQTAVDELWRDKGIYVHEEHTTRGLTFTYMYVCLCVCGLFINLAIQVAAGSSCAQPGRSSFSDSGTIGGFAGVI